jgi:hypothetical protein
MFLSQWREPERMGVAILTLGAAVAARVVANVVAVTVWSCDLTRICDCWRMPGLAEVCIEFRGGYGGAAMQSYVVAATTSCGTTVITKEEY